MPVELPKAIAAIVPRRKSAGGWHTATTTTPIAQPTRTYTAGINRSGHADVISRKSTDGSTVEEGAGIVSCIDTDERPLVASASSRPAAR